jgi:hypothetical protein
LALGQRHPEHLDAVVLGGVDGKAAPATTDIEQALARLERELLAHQVELCPLGLLERLRTALEVSTAVGHRRVEEQRKELVAGVVVVADGAAVAADRVTLAAQTQLGRGRLRELDEAARADQRDTELGHLHGRQRRRLERVDDP